MIIDMNAIMGEMYELYPDIKPASLDKICKVGLKSINRIMRSGNELLMRGPGIEDMKFFIPMTEEKHERVMKRRYFKNKIQKENARKKRDKQL